MLGLPEDGNWQHELDMTRLAGSHPHIVELVGIVVAEEGDDAPVGLIFRLHGTSYTKLLNKVK
jgi:hypothetical protein